MAGRKRVRGARRRTRLGVKGTPDTVPMSYERRLSSYGLRDMTGPTGLRQTPAQRRRIRHKIGHVQRRSVGSNE